MLNKGICPVCGSNTVKRTGAQNRIYWALLQMISEQLKVKGQTYNAAVWNEYLKTRYLGCEDIILPNGKTLTLPRSTTTLSKEEFTEYFERVMSWAAEHGVVLPDIDGNI